MYVDNQSTHLILVLILGIALSLISIIRIVVIRKAFGIGLTHIVEDF
jgi:hypothetical protein